MLSSVGHTQGGMISTLQSKPPLSLALLALAARVFTSALLLAFSLLLPAFDSSAEPLLAANPGSDWLEPFLRWDTLYFVSIATRGYVYEQELAFSPGLPGIMHVAGKAILWIEGAGTSAQATVRETMIGGILASWLAGVGAVLALYKSVQPHTSPRNRHADPCSSELAGSLTHSQPHIPSASSRHRCFSSRHHLRPSTRSFTPNRSQRCSRSSGCGCSSVASTSQLRLPGASALHSALSA